MSSRSRPLARSIITTTTTAVNRAKRPSFNLISPSSSSARSLVSLSRLRLTRSSDLSDPESLILIPGPSIRPVSLILLAKRNHSSQAVSTPSELRRKLRLPGRRPSGISKRSWNLIRGLRITYIGRPGVRVVEKESEEMPKAAFYAVAAGRKAGVYTTWSEAEAQVKGYAGARYKKFPTEAQARDFITSESAPSSVRAAAANYAASGSSRRPIAIASSSKAGPSTIVSSTTLGTHTRAESPPTNAPCSTLPARLRDLAKEGYMFTKGPVHYLVVHTDGSALGNGKVGSRAGAGVFWGSSGDAASRNLSERVPGLPQTNNRGELLAVIRALENCPFPDIPLEVRCDSQYTISCMTTWLPKWLRTNFRTSSTPYTRNNGSVSASGSASASMPKESKQVSNVNMVKHLLVLLRRRGTEGRVKFKYVPAHTGIEGNEAADKLAKMGSMSPEVPSRTDWLDPDKEPIGTRNTTEGTGDAKNGGLSDSGVTDIEVEIDENWLMSPEEWASLEEELVET